jgi:predicted enzyme related to lactoylglutathione lyase
MTTATPSLMVHDSPNTFFWADLGTSHVDDAQAFYAKLFDWEVRPVPMGNSTYVKFAVDGKQVAALYEMVPGQVTAGYPVAWMPYLWVDDVDASTALVAELGGKVLRGPFDVGEQGRTSSVQDPAGATFYLWQPNQHRGAELFNQPGALAWVELATPDPLEVAPFYTGVLGWGVEMEEIVGKRYRFFTHQGRRVAGMAEKSGQAPIWRIYFSVSDCEAAIRRADSLGGTVIIQPMDIPGMGLFAALRDPQGVGFAVVQLTQATE